MLVWLKYQYVKGKVHQKNHVITDSIFKEEVLRIGRSGHFRLFFIQLQRKQSKEFKFQKGCKGTIDNTFIFLAF